MSRGMAKLVSVAAAILIVARIATPAHAAVTFFDNLVLININSPEFGISSKFGGQYIRNGGVFDGLSVEAAGNEIIITDVASELHAAHYLSNLDTVTIRIMGIFDLSDSAINSIVGRGGVQLPRGYQPPTLTANGISFNLGGVLFPKEGSSLTLVLRSTSAVPEPDTWAMMLLGSGLIGAALRYRFRNLRLHSAAAFMPS